jgi:hypothetical protein
MQRICEAGYDTTEDKRAEAPRPRVRPVDPDAAPSPAGSGGARRLYCVGGAGRVERRELTGR